jgi:hypothetical protein
MKAGRRADEIRAPLPGRAAGELGIFEILAAGEVPVDERRIGERPQVSRLYEGTFLFLNCAIT